MRGWAFRHRLQLAAAVVALAVAYGALAVAAPEVAQSAALGVIAVAAALWVVIECRKPRYSQALRRRHGR